MSRTLSRGTECLDGGMDGLTEDEFIANWGKGARQSWINLSKLALRFEDFPLQPLPDNPTIMRGNLGEALGWLHETYEPSATPGFLLALENIQAARCEAGIGE